MRAWTASCCPITVAVSSISLVRRSICCPRSRFAKGRIALLMDSGIRRGSDVAQALALGADAVLVGRAMLYGLAAGSEAGAARALAILADELALLGRPTVDALDASIFAKGMHNGPVPAMRPSARPA